MLKIWDATNFRRTLGGLCLILAPVLFAVAEITYPNSSGNGAEQLDAAARNHNVMLADIYFGMASAILFMPAIYALLHVLRKRGVVLGHIAAILTVAGVCLAHLALGGLQLMLWAMAGPEANRQAMASFIDKTQQNPVALPLVLGHDLFALGIIIFGIAIWRSGFGYRWAGPAIAIGVVLDIVGGTIGLPDMLMAILSDGIFVTGLAAVGLKVLLTTDAEWEALPETVRAQQQAVAPAF
jgi:ABC-type Na+ efflux pump permease subunit